MKGPDDLRKRVEDLARSIATDQTDKVGKALRAVRTLAGKGRDPSLVMDALEDLVAAATRAEIEDSKLELYKKVCEQCRKMEHLGPEDFGSLCLCLLGDNVDQKIAEGMARFNKIRRRAGEARPQQAEKAGGDAAPHQGPAPYAPPPPPGYGWQYQSPIPAYPPPNQGSYGPRRGRGRGRGGASFGAKACYFCKREGHYMANCEELKSLKEK